MKKILVVVITVTVGVLAYFSWGHAAQPGFGGTSAPASSAEATRVGLQEEPVQRFRFALIDPTTSTDAAFKESMKAKIIAAVGSYVPVKPSDTKDGVPALAGIHLVVRLVGTVPLQYGAPDYTVDIPSVPALPSRPDMTAPGALDPGSSYSQWKDAQKHWSSKYDAALAAGQEAVTTLQGINLDLGEWSAVTSGVVSLALVAPNEGDVAFLVMSDLDENQPQQPVALAGHPFTVVQPDPIGEIGRWDTLFTGFSLWAKANGAGEIVRVRPEASDDVIRTFIQGA